MKAACWLLLLSTLSWLPAAEPDIWPTEVYVPATEAGLLNVRKHGVMGDGTTDDTSALRRLIAANLNGHKTLYFPAGIYLVNDTLSWTNEKGEYWPFTTWRGDGRGRTVIRLRDAAPGFTDAAKPKSVVATGCYDGKTRMNAAHNCYFFDLAIDVGSGNPGAIALDYISNNNGAVVRVDLRAGEDSGLVGLDLTRDSPGPALIKQVSIAGFATGVRVTSFVFSMTFEELVLRGQRTCGMSNRGNTLAIRKLDSRNTVPAVMTDGWASLTVLLDSRLAGGAPAAAAVQGGDWVPGFVARNVQVEGYGKAFVQGGKDPVSVPAAAFATEFIHGRRAEERLFNGRGPVRTLGLPVQETPDDPLFKAEDVAVVTTFGARGDGKTDDSAAVQAAIDSGKAVVVFPRVDPERQPRYRLDRPVVVRGKVRRLMGFSANIGGDDPTAVIFRCENAQPVVFDQFNWWSKGQIVVAKDAVVLAYGPGPEPAPDRLSMLRFEGTGRLLFLQDVHLIGLRITPGNRVYARQWNCEPGPKEVDFGFHNQGGLVWSLGLKSEQGNTLGRTTDGGFTEVLGCLMLPAQGFPKGQKPAWLIENAALSLSWTEMTFGSPRYEERVVEIRGKERRVYAKPAKGTQDLNALFLALPDGMKIPTR